MSQLAPIRMTRFKIIFLLLIWTLGSRAQTTNSTKSYIKSIKTYSPQFEIDGSDTILSINNKKCLIKKFDTLANLTDEISIDTAGNIESQHTYKYDNNGEILEIAHFYQDTLSNYQIFNRTDTSIYEYWIRKRNEPKYYHVIRTIDDKGNISKMKIAGKDSIYDTKWMYKYDDKNKIQLETAYQGHKLWQEINKSFDSNGNMLLFRNYFFEDDQKRLFQESIFKYNENGLVQMHSSKFGKTEYFYNAMGDQTLIKQTGANGYVNKTIFQYDYDNRGNWLKRIRIWNGNLIEIEKKEIRYFK